MRFLYLLFMDNLIRLAVMNFIISEISKIPYEILRFAAALSFLNEVKNLAAARSRMTRV